MNTTNIQASAAGRLLILIYGIVCYFLGVAGLGALIAVLAQLMPWGFLTDSRTGYPLLTNLTLVALWGIIHSVMARDRFKGLFTRLIPEPAERPTYVLVAGVTTMVLVGCWQPMPGVVWQVEQPLAGTALWGLFAFGWVYLLAATFAINHFDLFGLRQVYFHFANRPRPPVSFVKRYMYSFSRHPIQTGVLIGVWATPLMTAGQLVLSLGFTVYIFVGLWFEERDLVRDIGAPYVAYRAEAGMLGPKLFRQ